MVKPTLLTELLEELQGEDRESAVETTSHSKAAIIVGDPEDTDYDENGIQLTAAECKLVFASPSTVNRLSQAVGGDDATVTLFDLALPTRVLDELEICFKAVDEE